MEDNGRGDRFFVLGGFHDYKRNAEKKKRNNNKKRVIIWFI